MKTKAHGFIGESLIRGREARGFSQAELARSIDKTRSAVSQYESGKNPPSLETMARIEAVLNLPPHYFRRIPPKVKNGTIFYRSMSATTKSARIAAERRYEWLKEIVRFVRGYVNLPEVNFPDFELPTNLHKIDAELIELAATETRRFWGLGDGVISNVTWLLENNGAIVSRFELDAETLDAFSEFNQEDETPYIILGADKNKCARSRFDAAHELGHLILHRNIDRTRINHTSDFALIERQANRFAGAFLFPAKSYHAEVFMPSLDNFRVLKTKWQVSIQLMIYRAQDLGIISQEQAGRLFKSCNRRGWKYEEPYDDVMLVEQPRLLRRAMQMLTNEKVLSPYDVLYALPFARRDLIEFASLPKDFFEEKIDSVISLKDVIQSRHKTESDEDLDETSESDYMLTRPIEKVAQILEFKRFRA